MLKNHRREWSYMGHTSFWSLSVMLAVVTSAQVGNPWTTISCKITTGKCDPSMFIFLGIYETWINGRHTTKGNILLPSITLDSEQNFSQWSQHFLQFCKSTNTDVALLVFDSHYPHTSNLGVNDIASQHHVSLICLLLILTNECAAWCDFFEAV
jgi:hypothetical protein